MLECPKCREFAVVPLPVYRVSDKLTHGCEACGLKLKAFFLEPTEAGAEWLRALRSTLTEH